MRVFQMLILSWADTFNCDAAKSLTFNGLTTQIFKSCMANGEALALPLWLENRPFSTAIQLVEPDRLSNPNNQSDTETMRGGIEIDKYGAPIAYHILKNHPGDF